MAGKIKPSTKARKAGNGPELAKGIRDQLRPHFPSKPVDTFIEWVLLALGVFDAAGYGKPKEERTERLKGQLKAADSFLRGMRVHACPLQSRVDDFIYQRGNDSGLQEAISAVTAYRDRIAEAIAQTPKAKPPAGSDGLLAQIALGYERILGEEPTETEGGRFFNVAVHVRKYIDGKEHKAPRRHVEAALDPEVTARNARREQASFVKAVCDALRRKTVLKATLEAASQEPEPLPGALGNVPHMGN